MTQTDRLNTALTGRYRIERELGAGGMATVYLAEDLKHDRKVAIKVLKPELAAVLGAERFVVEIKTTAALSHPHILPLFDSGTADGFLFYVMPFIKGETIREKLNRETQFGVDEAVRIAREVADALDYAHRHGVIHRDIKPENILLHDGRAMVMDFGIALAVSAAAGGRMTETGLSLGTPHYMSPEQATADKEITGRSDVYSLASVLYEMLAGVPPHEGGSAQQVIMRIIADTPRPVSDLRKSVPPNVAAALAKALEKLPADRFESARAFAEALGSSGFTHRTSAATGVPAAPAPTSRNRLVLVTLGVLLLATAAVAAWGWLRPQPFAPTARLDLNLGAVPPLPNTDVVISPDGSMLAYSGAIGGGQPFIYLRRLDGGGDFQRLEGTGSGFAPDFSPDSRWIVFRRDRQNALAKVSVAGAGASPIPATEGAFYAHWGPNDQIIYTGPRGAFIVPASGGTAVNIGDQAGLPVLAVRARHVSLLPDGSGVLGEGDQNIVVYSFTTKKTTVVARNGRHPVYAESGHILYVSDDNAVFAVPFDLKRHRVTDDPVRVVDRVVNSIGTRGYSISRNGTLVYFEGPASGASSSATNLFAVVRFAGGIDTLRLQPGRLRDPRFSPNGKVVAYVLSAQTGIDDNDLYTYDLATRTNTQITFGGNARDPIWSPDGARLLYSMRDSSGNHLLVKAANNSGTDTTVVTGQGELLPSGWPQPDVVLLSGSSSSGLDLFVVSPRDGASMRPYLSEASDDRDMTLSPDGKLAALVNDDGVWLRDFPAPVGKWRVSASGDFPRWSRDGRYVYFWRRSTPYDTLYRARVDRTPAVVVNAPEATAAIDAAGIENWDLHPDGTRFIVAVPDVSISATLGAPGTPGARRHLVVLNWFTELNARMKPK